MRRFGAGVAGRNTGAGWPASVCRVGRRGTAPVEGAWPVGTAVAVAPTPCGSAGPASGALRGGAAAGAWNGGAEPGRGADATTVRRGVPGVGAELKSGMAGPGVAGMTAGSWVGLLGLGLQELRRLRGQPGAAGRACAFGVVGGFEPLG